MVRTFYQVFLDKNETAPVNNFSSNKKILNNPTENRQGAKGLGYSERNTKVPIAMKMPPQMLLAIIFLTDALLAFQFLGFCLC
jgi:hypothetical protein